jgi:hypothetical protein
MSTTQRPAREAQPAKQDNGGEDNYAATPLTSRGPRISPVSDREEVAVEQRPTHYWTWRLLAKGFSAAECAAIRGLDAESVLKHLLSALEEGRDIDPRWCLSEELLSALEPAVDRSSSADVRHLLRRLPPGTRPLEVELYLKSLRRSAGG